MQDKIFGIDLTKDEIIDHIEFCFIGEDSLDGFDIKINKRNIYELWHEDYAEFFDEIGNDIIETYIVIFTEKEIPKQYFTINEAIVKNIECNISISEGEPRNFIIIYQSLKISNLKIEEMKDILLTDLFDIGEKLGFLEYMDEAQIKINFYTDIIDKYLVYLDKLINYDEFRKKMSTIFNLLYRKINEFYLKLLTIRSEVETQFIELADIKKRNPRAVLLIESNYSDNDIDIETALSSFKHLENKFNNVKEFTRSMNESRQAIINESIGNIMFWVGIISFFFGIIGLVDKYQTQSNYGLETNDAFFNLLLIILPFTFLFIIIFIKYGQIFERIIRLLNTVSFKLKCGYYFPNLNNYLKRIGLFKSIDKNWFDMIEQESTTLNSELFYTTIKLDLNNQIEKNYYKNILLPKSIFIFEILFGELLQKMDLLSERSSDLSIKNRQKQLDAILEEVYFFTAINNWQLEKVNILEPGLRVLENLFIWVLYFEFKQSFGRSLDSDDVELGIDSYISSAPTNDDIGDSEIDYCGNYVLYYSFKIPLLKTHIDQIISLSPDYYKDDIPFELFKASLDPFSFESEMESDIWIPEEYLETVKTSKDIYEPECKIKEVIKELNPILIKEIKKTNVKDFMQHMEDYSLITLLNKNK